MERTELTRREALRRVGGAAAFGAMPVGWFSPNHYEPTCLVDYHGRPSPSGDESGVLIRYSINDDEMYRAYKAVRIDGPIDPTLVITANARGADIEIPASSDLLPSDGFFVDDFDLEFLGYNCTRLSEFAVTDRYYGGGPFGGGEQLSAQGPLVSSRALRSATRALNHRRIHETCTINPPWGQQLYEEFSAVVPEYNESVAEYEFESQSGRWTKRLLGGSKQTLHVSKGSGVRRRASGAVYRVAFDADLQIASFEEGVFEQGGDSYTSQATMREIIDADNKMAAFLGAAESGEVKLGGFVGDYLLDFLRTLD